MNVQNNRPDLANLMRAALKNQPAAALMIQAFEERDGKLSLRGTEVDALAQHVAGLKAAEQTAAVDAIRAHVDAFEIPDAGKNAWTAFLKNNNIAEPVRAGGPQQSVAKAAAAAATPAPQATAGDVAEVREAMGTLPDGMRGEASAATQQARQDGTFKVNSDAQKEYTKTVAANHDPVLDAIADYEKSPFFEDRLLAFSMRHGYNFIKSMNGKIADFDNPQKQEEIKQAFKDSARKMMEMAGKLDPAAKARMAEGLATFLEQNPQAKELEAFGEFVTKTKAAVAKNGDVEKTPAEIVAAMPEPDNNVLAAMRNSTRPEVYGYAAIIDAASRAKDLEGLAANVVGNPKADESEMREAHAKMKEFSGTLEGLKQMLPRDMRDQFPSTDIGALPKEMDATSRQLMFQQINMMMNQYQQIMQALSELINKMNEMAMDPIRKMGR